MKLNVKSNDNIYIVNAGDTLYSIAKKNNISIDDLKRLNNITSDILKVGQKIIITDNDIEKYIVKVGDTLWSIAQKYNTSVNLIKRLNNLTNDILTIGQVINIK